MEDGGRGPLPSAIASLLADIAGHHKRLGQASQDLSSALAEAQATAGLAQQLLQGSTEKGFGSGALKVPAALEGGAVFVTAPPDAPHKVMPAVAEEEMGEVFAVPSEWHQRLLDKHSSQNVKEIKRALQESDAGYGTTDSFAYTSDAQLETKAVWDCKKSDGGEDEDAEGFSAEKEEEEEESPPRRRSLLSSDFSEESWDFSNNIVRRYAIARLQERLGKTTMKGNVAAFQVYSALQSMEFMTYTMDNIERWFGELERINAEAGRPTSWHRASLFRMTTSAKSTASESYLGGSAEFSSEDTLGGTKDHKIPGHIKTIRFKVFVDTILDDELILRLSSDLQKMSLTIREVLCSGDANRLVSRLTRVNIEEVAAPMEKPDFLTRMEPFVAFVIALNGVFIGVQTSATYREGLDAWFWGNVLFAVLMVLEIFLRVYMASDLIGFVRGHDKWWNIFDCSMIVVAVCDIGLEAAQVDSQMSSIAIMRVMRLTRLTRLIRIFRLRVLTELNTMIRGLIGGLRTLFWAIVLLFFTLYIIGVWLTTTIGPGSDLVLRVPEVAQEELFTSVPRAVVTCFRCFMGDCETRTGRPIIKLLADAYGFSFILGYMASTVFIVFGLFNLIIAVYVESTMSAAKTEGKKTLEERGREAVRVAQMARKLLKKFCVADRLWATRSGQALDKRTFIKAMQSSAIDDVEERSMQVSKELYLCVIQDPGVMKILDDMDIPPERPHLFDILDADCSGDLEVSELITGLLRVRGEAKKSDVIGTLLGVRALLEMLKDQNHRMVGIELQLEKINARASSAPGRLGLSRSRSALGGRPSPRNDLAG